MNLTIRPIHPDDLAALQQQLRLWGPPDYHAQKLQMQAAGEILWLIAWLDGEPVGHLQIFWDGSERAENRAYSTAPKLSDIGVKKTHRSAGIGTALIRTVEGLARMHGYRQVALEVNIENERARQLYERLGYHDWGKGTYTISWDKYDEQGQAQLVYETCVFLVKAL